MFIKLLATRIVAKRSRGFCLSLMMISDREVPSSAIFSKSVGVREKNDTSDPLIKAEQMIKMIRVKIIHDEVLLIRRNEIQRGNREKYKLGGSSFKKDEIDYKML